jgi:hypothetical protein
MSDDSRAFWIKIRRGLIIVIDAIDERFALPTVRAIDPPFAPAPPANGFTPQSERPQSATARVTPRKDMG